MSDARERYRGALRWLYEFSDWERGIGWNPSAAPDEQWKLGRTRALLDTLGSPDRRLRCVLVAGTKGKGSTATMIESIARTCGWSTGLYTQPHLHSYRERIAINGAPISQTAFADGVADLRRAVVELSRRHPTAGQPTTFELTTVLALVTFARRAVDLTILEVGLGGRLDATNVVDPALAVITPIGLDHTQVLGPTIRQIAREKAGIIKAGARVIAARQRPAARREIEARCSATGATCRFVPPLTERQATALFREPRGPRDAPPSAESPIACAPHQRQNAAVAIAVAEELGLPAASSCVRAGLAAVRLPARFEVVVGAPTVVVDAAHNRDSARALVRAMRTSGLPRPRWLVLGILADKDARGVARPLAREIDGVVVLTAPSRRALPADQLARICRAAGMPDVREAESVATGLALARRQAGPGGSVIVAGSFTVASAARTALGLADGEP